jgi:hypothetical protein
MRGQKWIDAHVDHERGAGHKNPVRANSEARKEFMLVAKDMRTVCDIGGVPILEIIKEEGTITIFEADDMDQRVKFPAAVIPALINYLESLR